MENEPEVDTAAVATIDQDKTTELTAVGGTGSGVSKNIRSELHKESTSEAGVCMSMNSESEAVKKLSLNEDTYKSAMIFEGFRSVEDPEMSNNNESNKDAQKDNVGNSGDEEEMEVCESESEAETEVSEDDGELETEVSDTNDEAEISEEDNGIESEVSENEVMVESEISLDKNDMPSVVVWDENNLANFGDADVEENENEDEKVVSRSPRQIVVADEARDQISLEGEEINRECMWEEALDLEEINNTKYSVGEIDQDRTEHEAGDQVVAKEKAGDQEHPELGGDQERTEEDEVEYIEEELREQDFTEEKTGDQEYAEEEAGGQEYAEEEAEDQEYTEEAGVQENTGEVAGAESQEYTEELLEDQQNYEEGANNDEIEIIGESVFDEMNNDEIEIIGESLFDEMHNDEIEIVGEKVFEEMNNDAVESDAVSKEDPNASVMEVSVHVEENNAEVIDISEENEEEVLENTLGANISVSEPADTEIVTIVDNDIEPANTTVATTSENAIDMDVDTNIGEKNETAEVPLVLLYSCDDIYLYDIPKATEDRYKASKWYTSDPSMCGTLEMFSMPSSTSSFPCKIQLNDEDDTPYGFTFIDKYPGEVLMPTTDSTRYFLVKLTKINSYYNLPDVDEIVGLCFCSRNDSTKFITVLQDYLKTQSLKKNETNKRLEPQTTGAGPCIKKPKLEALSVNSNKGSGESSTFFTEKKFVLSEKNMELFIRVGLPVTEQGMFSCHICAASFNDMRHIKSHWFKVHNLKHPAHCVVCKQPFHNRDSMMAHRIKFHGFECPKTGCGKKFKLPTSLSNHYSSAHGLQLVFPCTMCKEKFPSSAALKLHLDDKHRNPDGSSILFSCPHLKCEVKLFTETELVGHVATHQRFILCQICDERFSNRGDLRKHCQEIHPGTREVRI